MDRKPNPRRFSTALPSVTSLRSKFEKPGVSSTVPSAFSQKRPKSIIATATTTTTPVMIKSTATPPERILEEEEETDDNNTVNDDTVPTSLVSSVRKKSIFNLFRRESSKSQPSGEEEVPSFSPLRVSRPPKGQGQGVVFCVLSCFSFAHDFFVRVIEDLSIPPPCQFLFENHLDSDWESCFCVVAFVRDVLAMDSHIRSKVSRALALNKQVVLLMESNDLLVSELLALFDPEWLLDLSSSLLVYTCARHCPERTLFLTSFAKRLNLMYSPSSTFSALLPPNTMPTNRIFFLLMGGNPDVREVLCCELLAHGYVAYSLAETSAWKSIPSVWVIFLLATRRDEEDADELQNAIQAAQRRVLRLPCSSVVPIDAHKDVVLPTRTPRHVLFTQTAVLTPFHRIVAQSRRFLRPLDALRDSLFFDTSAVKVLSLQAPLGWGKTCFLARLACQHHVICNALSKQPFAPSLITVSAVYFFSQTDPKLFRSAAYAIRSLSRQLLALLPSFAIATKSEEVDEVLSDANATLASLLDVLILQPCSKLAMAPLSRVVLILDALEECEDMDNLVAAINGKWISACPSWLMLCVSSRSKLNIPQARSVMFAHDMAEMHSVAAQCTRQDIVIPFAHYLHLQLFCDAWHLIRGHPELYSFDALVAFLYSKFAPVYDLIFNTRTYASVPVDIVRRVSKMNNCANLPGTLLSDDGVLCPLHVSLLLPANKMVYADNVLDGFTTLNSSLVARCFAHSHGTFYSSRPLSSFASLYRAVEACVWETGSALRLSCDFFEKGDELLADVLRLGNHALQLDVRELCGQIMGRLPRDHVLVHEARAFALEHFSSYRIHLPLSSSSSGLLPAGGPFQRSLKHRNAVLCMQHSNGFLLTGAGPIGFVWRVDSDSKVAFFKGHTDDVTCCDFHVMAPTTADTTSFFALTGSNDFTCKFWTGLLPLATTAATTQTILTCTKTFSASNKSPLTCVLKVKALVFTACQDGVISVFDFVTCAAMCTLPTPGRHFAVDAQSTLLYTCSDQEVLFYSLEDQPKLSGKLGFCHPRDVSFVLVGPAPGQLYTACFDGHVRSFVHDKLMFDVSHSQRINALALYEDYLASCSYDSTCVIWHAFTGEKLLVCAGHTNDVSAVSFTSSPGVFVTSSLDMDVRVWRVSGDIVLRNKSLLQNSSQDHTTCVSLSVNENFAIFGSAHGHVGIINLRTQSLEYDGYPTAAAAKENEGEALTSVAISDEGTRFVTGDGDGVLRMYTRVQDAVINTTSLVGHVDVLECIRFSRDQEFIRSTTCDQSEEFTWECATGKRTVTSSAFPAIPKVVHQERNPHHVSLSSSSSSVSFTLDVPNFNCTHVGRKVFGEMHDSIFIWEEFGE